MNRWARRRTEIQVAWHQQERRAYIRHMDATHAVCGVADLQGLSPFRAYVLVHCEAMNRGASPDSYEDFLSRYGLEAEATGNDESKEATD